MILTGNEDLRVVKTIEGIKSAFEDLICEKDYEKITVKELCERARINKKTFYHYYPTLDDLLAEMQVELSSVYINKVKDYQLPDDIEKVNREFFLFSEGQGLAYEKITTSGSYDYVRSKMIGKVMDATWKRSDKFSALAPLEQNILMNYMTSVSIGIYKQWVAEGKKTPIDKVIMIANNLLLGGMKGFFE